MSQSIGKNIRKFRKDRNLTQEELAELLNVTSQAISKWENGIGMPDISQVVPLASVFGISTDLLLGVSGENEQDEVETFIEDLHIKNKNLEITDYQEYLQKREALKKYPNNFTLLYSCFVRGCFILQTNAQDSLSLEEQQSIYRECIRQSNVIFAHCPNTALVINTKRELVGLLKSRGENERALNLIAELPNSVTDVSGMIRARFMIGNKNWADAIEACHANIYELLREMQHQIKLLASAYLRNGEYGKAETVCLTALDLVKAIFKDETYTPPFHIEQSLYRFLAICAMKRNDHEQAIAYLEDMYDYTLAQNAGFHTIMHVKTPLLESYEMDFNYPYYEPRTLLLGVLDKTCFKPLAEHQAFLDLKSKVMKLTE